MTQKESHWYPAQACPAPEPEHSPLHLITAPNLHSGNTGRLGNGQGHLGSSEKERSSRFSILGSCLGAVLLERRCCCFAGGLDSLLCPALSPDEVPQVTVQPASTVQKLGGTVILGCVVEPPWVNVTWRLNGKELNGSDEALGVLLTRGTLVITALNNRTVGRYQCVARMPAGAVASVPATVTLASEFAPLPV